jgi:preprotein translocase subunit Sec61beta
MAKLERQETKEIGADRRIFPRVVLMAGIALLVILVAAIFIVRPAAKKIQPVTPNGRSAVQVLQMERFA